MKRIKKERKKKIMEKIRKAGSEKYETSWDEKGVPKSKKKSEIKKGRTSRARGARFELKVRAELEAQGWIMDKWTNNVDLDEGKIVKAKRKYNPFKKMLIVGTGFPDFISFKKKGKKGHEVIGVEVKINGILSKIEKEKCAWYLNKGIFSKILIAKAVKEGRKINVEYVDFRERYVKLFKK
ncbi:hypothetical protein GOV13_01960 [Candidatus Pacearchaeota archaeon]|nr:hypothetical protein [Candidatus Pacearchaeota archaeon]